MAEVGLIASIIGIAGAGIKLSITLYTFSETVSTAQSDIKDIARGEIHSFPSKPHAVGYFSESEY
jgi:hypothetical protein